MPATIVASLQSTHPMNDGGAAALQQPSLSTSAVSGGVDSSTLLNGQKTVTIVHNGTPYRLQATKLGKLILTK